MNDEPLTPPRTAGSQPSDAVLKAIVAAGRHRRRRLAAWTTSAVAVTGLAAAAVGAGDRLSDRTAPPHRLGSPATPSGTCAAPPPPTPVPGSTPAYRIGSARDWFFSKEESDEFFRGFNEPSPRPEDTVPSPQPSGPLTSRLVQALEAAGVPGAAQLDRDEADSGRRGSISLDGKLPDGSDLAVYRTQTNYPMTLSGYSGSDTEDSTKDLALEDVPGTACVGLFPRPGTPTARLHFVQVMTPDGVATGWSSARVPIDQLKRWAYAAAQWETEHPTP